jgi:peptidyl-prolyl cis-trans isomerase C
MLLGILVI